MSRWSYTATACLLAAGCSNAVAPAQAANSGRSANAVHVQRAQIIDNNGFGQPVAATFVMIPVGWRTQGGVQWGQQFTCTNGYNFSWRAVSPDGTQAVGILPMEKWSSSNFGSSPLLGCPSAPYSSIQQYLESIAGRYSAARMLDFRLRRDLARDYAYLNMRTPMPMGEVSTNVQAGQLLFAYNEQGRDMRGVVTAVTVFSLSRMSGISPGQTMDSLTGASYPVYVATAPNGQLNLRLVEAIRQTFRPNPQWQLLIAQHNGAIAEQERIELNKRSRMWAETTDYIAALRADTQAARDQSNERIQRGQSDAMKGVVTYDDSNAATGRVELSSYFDNAWRLKDGTYALSEDANFEPYRDLGLEGRKLEPTR
jgi:ADP-ribose pyrophosphatase YjhB (NUDIX family)